MKIVNLRDNNFGHQEYVSKYGSSNLIKWDRNCSQSGTTVYTDMYLNDSILRISGDKVAWLVEPISIHGHIYNWIVRNHNNFKEVWTHDDEILKIVPNAKFVPTGGAWVDLSDHKIWDKTELCSFIASNKNWTVGHQLRQHIRAILPSNIPQFGKGYKEIKEKSEALNKFAYSITVENIQRDTYYTEKIIDCFLTGTIPIYWGTKKVNNFFDENGIIHFNTVEELQTIIQNISLDDYNSKMKSIRNNFEEAKKYIIPEEWGIKSW